MAVDDSWSTPRNTTLTITTPGILNDNHDPDNLTAPFYAGLTAILTPGSLTPNSGTLTWNGANNGGFTYAPASNTSGTVTFKYKAYDGVNYSNEVTVTITIDGNGTPTAANVSGSGTNTDEDTPKAITLLGSDGDIGQTLTYQLSQQPGHGTLSGFSASAGTVTYTPDLNWNGTDSFTYLVNDGQADSNVGTVTIVVAAVNDAPVGAADHINAFENDTLVVDAPGVLGNDADMEGDSIAAVKLTDTAHGELSAVFAAGAGSFTYTPASAFLGTDSFTYKVCDDYPTNLSCSAAVTVTIHVTPESLTPTASNYTYGTGARARAAVTEYGVDWPAFTDLVAEDGTFTVLSNNGLLNTDLDPDHDQSLFVVTNPLHGTLTITTGIDGYWPGQTNHAKWWGAFVYTPVPDWFGTDTFTYQLRDENAESNVASVFITVTAVNDVPRTAADAVTTGEDATLSTNAPGVLGNDIDIEGDGMVAVQVTGEDKGPSHGTVTLHADGSFEYAPAANYNGSDSFTYKACDDSPTNTHCSDDTLVTLTVTSVNDPAIAADDTYGTNESTQLSPNAAAGVLANDTDVDTAHGSLVASLVAGPSHAAVGGFTLNGDGSFAYTPAADWFGTDTFTYEVTDGGGAYGLATVTITVTRIQTMTLAFHAGSGGSISVNLTRNAADQQVGATQTLDFATDYASRVTVVANVGTQGGVTLGVVASGGCAAGGTPTCTASPTRTLGTTAQDLVTGMDGTSSTLTGSFDVTYTASTTGSATLGQPYTWNVTYTLGLTNP